MGFSVLVGVLTLDGDDAVPARAFGAVHRHVGGMDRLGRLFGAAPLGHADAHGDVELLFVDFERRLGDRLAQPFGGDRGLL